MNKTSYTPGSIKYLFEFNDPVQGNSRWMPPVKVKFLNDYQCVEINFDNTRKSYYQDDYNPKPDRLGYILNSAQPHTYVCDSYQEAHELYYSLQEEAQKDKIAFYKMKLEQEEYSLKVISEKKATKPSYTTNKHGNPSHVSQTTTVFNVSKNDLLQIHEIFTISSKYSIKKSKPNSELGEAKLICELDYLKGESLILLGNLLQTSVEELKMHTFIIFTSDSAFDDENKINTFVPDDKPLNTVDANDGEDEDVSIPFTPKKSFLCSIFCSS